MSEDLQLLRRYAAGTTGSEEAFAELVRRHLNLVFSAAARVLGPDPHRAEDVAQLVFTNLARRAREIPDGTVLAGWLHRDACFKARELFRRERRLKSREESAMQEAHPPGDDVAWEQLRPILDESLQELSGPDRDALLLRFFERLSLTELGGRLGVGESGASRRVSQALERLRSVLARRGVTTTAAALGLVMTTQSVTAAPAGLAAAITAQSLASVAIAGSASAGAVASTAATTSTSAALSTSTSAFNLPFATTLLAMKTKWIVVGAVLLVLLGGTGFVAGVNLFHEHLGQMRQAQRQKVVAEQRQRVAQAMPAVLQLVRYAADHGGRLPTSLAEAGVEAPDFELLPGTTTLPSGPDQAPVPILRERQSWTGANGKLGRVYGFSDGHAEVVSEGDPRFR